MQRYTCAQRTNWKQKIERDGITFSATLLPDGSSHEYWKEGAYYAFSPAEIDQIEAQTKVIFDMLVEAGDYIVGLPEPQRRELMLAMKLPEFTHRAIIDSWNAEPADQSVYGRFDFQYSGAGSAIKLYEFNAQTPTSLVESAYAQWKWLEETKAGPDQWNLLWESLVAAWRRNLACWGPRMGFDPNANPYAKPIVYFAYSPHENQGEDELTVSYLADSCAEAGYRVRKIEIEHIKLFNDRFYVPRPGIAYIQDGPDQDIETYADTDLEHLNICFVLYPYEWMWQQQFGRALFANMELGPRLNNQGAYVGGTIWFEAPYKMLWSNKAILPILWQLFGDDPQRSQHLIPAWFHDDAPPGAEVVEKPIFAREGASIRILNRGNLIEETPGDYASDDPSDYIVQAYSPPANFCDEAGQTVHTVLGVWVIDGEPAGLGIREDTHPVTGGSACFVPHIITSDDPNASWENPNWTR